MQVSDAMLQAVLSKNHVSNVFQRFLEICRKGEENSRYNVGLKGKISFLTIYEIMYQHSLSLCNTVKAHVSYHVFFVIMHIYTNETISTLCIDFEPMQNANEHCLELRHLLGKDA